MADLATIQNPKPIFDFETNSVEQMDLATLRRTHRENTPNGDPIRGMYHFQAIERIGEMCRAHGLDYQIEEIFAAQNRNKTQPGVSLLPSVEAQYIPKAIEAHILRRVYTTIRIDNDQTNELTTTLVVAFHQDGLQVAIGPCVKICHNQCILSAERSIADYGKTKVPTEQVFATVDGWLRDFAPQMQEDRARINRLKNTPVSEQEILTYIGILTTMRVAHDSSDKRLRNKVDTYPLNSAQINRFTEDILKKMHETPNLTAWDVYNVATEYYKADEAEIPTLIPQNLAFTETLFQFLERKPAAKQPVMFVEAEVVS